LSLLGIPVRIRVGVRRLGRRVEGHAWLEYGGVPLADPLARGGVVLPLEFSSREAE